MKTVFHCRSLSTLFVLLAVSLASAAKKGELPKNATVEQAIDFYIGKKLADEGVSPAGSASDSTLIRRLTLDLVGRIPTTYAAKAFVADKDKKKRLKLIDRLIKTSEFASHQADEFDTMLMFGSGGSLRGYLEKALGKNRPWDQMFRDMILVQDDFAKKNGAAEFIKRRVKDLDKLTNATSVVFFGVNISCAKCHDHPLVQDWKQDHFYGMKSFFNRTFDNGGFIAERSTGIVNFKTTTGQSRKAKLMFLTGKVLTEPKSPDKKALKKEKAMLASFKKKKKQAPLPQFSRRATLVDAAIKDTEKYFLARSIVNHMMARFLGRGLVMPVDQLHSENEPSHPELLQWLAADFVKHKYDLRRLIRGILLTDVYARSSQWDSAADRPEEELFAVGQLRALTPRQYAYSLRLGAANPDQFQPVQKNKKKQDVTARLKNVRNQANGLVSHFEQPRYDDFQISVDEALVMTNGKSIRDNLLNEGGDRLIGKLKKLKSSKEKITTAVWSVMSRAPEKEELAVLTKYLESRKDRQAAALRQLVWALLSSSECRFNH